MLPNESLATAKSVVHGHISSVIQAIERSEAVSYILDSQYRIMYCNPAWNRFAIANGAPQLANEAVVGSDLFAAIPEVLRASYSAAFRYVVSRGAFGNNRMNAPALLCSGGSG